MISIILENKSVRRTHSFKTRWRKGSPSLKMKMLLLLEGKTKCQSCWHCKLGIYKKELVNFAGYWLRSVLKGFTLQRHADFTKCCNKRICTMFFLFALFLPHCFQRIFRLKLNMYDYQNLVLLFKAFVTNNHSEGKGPK